jgi:hypothetical protein
VRFIEDKKLYYLGEYIDLEDGYVYGDDGYIYDRDGNRYTEEEYIKKVGLFRMFASFIKTGDVNMMLGLITIILLPSSFIVMILVRKSNN